MSSTAPTIPLVKESDVTDDGIREAYREIKNWLRVPAINALFQTYAATPHFLEVAWRRLRPSVLTPAFNEQAAHVGLLAERHVAGWQIGDHAMQLRGRAVAAADLQRMRTIADLFHVVNPKLLIIAHAIGIALGGRTIAGTGAGPSHVHHYASEVKEFRAVALTLSEERDAPPRVRAILDEVKAALGSGVVSSEYRALASYPDWLEVWWKDCKALLREADYQAARRGIGDAGERAAEELPHQFALGADLLERNDIDESGRAQLRERNAVFIELLPALILNMEIARRGLGAPAE